MRFWKRLKYYLQKEKFDRELAEEMQFHMEMKAAGNVDEGIEPAQASLEARRQFGNATLLQELCRDIWRFRGAELAQDIRFGLRVMLKNPGFFVVSILTLMLGIGANTAIFSVISAVLLRPLPFQNPERLVRIWPHGEDDSISKSEFVDLKTQSRSFEDVEVYTGWSFTLTGSGEPTILQGARTTAGFFSMLGVKAALGRTFLANEDQPGRNSVALLSYGGWQRRFGSTPNIIDKSIRLNGVNHTIVGVLPQDFRFPDEQFAGISFDIVVPAPVDPSDQDDFTAGYLKMMGRLRSGINPLQAQQELVGILRTMRAKYNGPEDYGENATMEFLGQELSAEIRPALFILLGAVLFVLLIACANVANLQLARAAYRRHELGLRNALGAGRGRIARQMLTESSLLFLLGGAAGIVLAFVGLRTFVSILPPDIPQINEIKIDKTVLLFSAGITVLTGILFGLFPALHAAQTEPQQDLRENRRISPGFAGAPLRRALVMVEVALALMLVTGAGLLVKSFQQLQAVNPGFQADNVLSARLAPAGQEYSENARKHYFYREVLNRIRALPDVTAAGAIHLLPMGDSNWNPGLKVEDFPTSSETSDPSVDWRLITSDYFRAMQIPLIRGRFFNARDTENSQPVVIVNESLALRYWPGQDPIGKRIRSGFERKTWVPVVGVVGDVKEQGQENPTNLEMYRPYEQASYSDSMILMVRSQTNPETLARAIRKEVWSVDKNVPVEQVQTLNHVISQSVSARRSMLFLVTVFAGIALTLGLIGIYGLISYFVSLHIPEIGVRMALGAQKSNILKMVIQQGSFPVFAGTVIGLAGSVAFSGLMTKLLFGVHPADPFVLAAVAFLLIATALFSSWIPAYRATRLNVVQALRTE